MVDAQRPGPVAAQGPKAHQPPVARLVQWVVSQQALGVAQRLIVLAFLFQQLDQLLHGPDVGLVQPLPLGQDPIVVTTGQQLAAHTARCPLQGGSSSRFFPGPFCSAHCLLKSGHIQGVGRLLAPLQRLSLDRYELVRIGQRLAQAVQQRAQVAVGLGNARRGSNRSR